MALMAATAVAQEYRYEVGPALGVSGYIGDISSGNMYKHPGIVGGGVFRYNMNSRIASEKLSRMWICGFILPLSQNIKKICDYDILTSWIALKKAGAWEDRMFDLLQLLREKVEPAV